MEGVDEIVVVRLDVGVIERVGLDDELELGLTVGLAERVIDELELTVGLAERVMEELRLTVEELDTI
jgi:hypothetical protein